MQLGLIGYPLEHSRSPEIFAGFFEREKIQGASYKLFPLENISLLHSWLKAHPQLDGFNVTIPHKKTIIPFLNHLSPEVKAIGSVNTVTVKRKKKTVELTGHNTDYYGFKTSLIDFLSDAKPAKAMILGTGGTAGTVAYTLTQLGIEWVKVSRNSTPDAPLTYSDISAYTLKFYELIINTTPLGMYPAVKTYPHLPYNALTPNHYLFDLVYNPAETLFLQKGRENSAHTRNGMQMLELQAEKAWEIFKTA